MIKLQIIILCKDNPSEVKFTLDSLPEDHSILNIVYLFIDGSSTGICKSIIDNECLGVFHYEYFNSFSMGISGIYPSMNLALSKLKSDWCIFMNSGDQFHDNFKFSLLLNLIDTTSLVQCVFGYSKIISPNGFSWYVPSPNINQIQRWCKYFEPTHQSMFVKSDLAIQYKFDELSRIGADSLWKRSIINNCYFIF